MINELRQAVGRSADGSEEILSEGGLRAAQWGHGLYAPNETASEILAAFRRHASEISAILFAAP